MVKSSVDKKPAKPKTANKRVYKKRSPGFRFTPEQRAFALKLLAQGYTTRQVNNRAKDFDPPFELNKDNATILRRENKVSFEKAVENGRLKALTSGLAEKEKRVELLQMLAYQLAHDLVPGEDGSGERVWMDRTKGIGSGLDFQVIKEEEFNASEIRELRGLLDDIAKEVGSRIKSDKEIFSQEMSNQILTTLPAEIISPAFLSVWRDIKNRAHMEYLLKGGRGSTKSSFTSLVIILLLMMITNVHAVVLRQVANTLRDSVYSQLVWAIGILGVSHLFKCITSPLEIEYLPTHQKIYFRGADKPEMIKSIKPVFGYIGILWFEELDQFKGAEAIRKIEQSTLRGGETAFEFKTYNPPRTAANWVNKYVLIPKENQLQHHSTYLDVPLEWLGQTFIDEAEHLKVVNETAYNHEYLGIITGTGGMVFENVIIRSITDDQIKEFDHVLHGLDWGYFPDPLSYGKMHYDAARLTLYIFDELRLYKKGNKAAYNELVKHGLQVNDLLIADSAEPKSIADFKEYGVNIRGAEKGPDSVDYSIKWLQSLKAIIIDPVRAPFHADEFQAYELEQDKNGDFISSYPDRDNHAIDDTRYATNLIWRRRGQ